MEIIVTPSAITVFMLVIFIQYRPVGCKWNHCTNTETKYKAVVGIDFYVVNVVVDTREISKMEFRVGQKVIAHKFTTVIDIEWLPEMEECIGEVGEIIDITRNLENENFALIKFSHEEYLFPFSAIEILNEEKKQGENKVNLKVGQRAIAHVFVSNENIEWLAVMSPYVEEIGSVMHVYDDGDCIVQFDNRVCLVWYGDALTPIEREKNEEPVNLTDDEKVRVYRDMSSDQHIEASTVRYVSGYVRADRDCWMSACQLARKELDKLEAMLSVNDDIQESLDYLKEILR